MTCAPLVSRQGNTDQAIIRVSPTQSHCWPRWTFTNGGCPYFRVVRCELWLTNSAGKLSDIGVWNQEWRLLFKKPDKNLPSVISILYQSLRLRNNIETKLNYCSRYVWLVHLFTLFCEIKINHIVISTGAQVVSTSGWCHLSSTPLFGIRVLKKINVSFPPARKYSVLCEASWPTGSVLNKTAMFQVQVLVLEGNSLYPCNEVILAHHNNKCVIEQKKVNNNLLTLSVRRPTLDTRIWRLKPISSLKEWNVYNGRRHILKRHNQAI